jgi:hypothetical protein
VSSEEEAAVEIDDAQDAVTAPRIPAADIFFADLDDSLPLLADDLVKPSEELALMGLCNCCTTSGLTMILMEDL